MAKISELEARKGFDVVEGTILSKGDARDVKDGALKVADAEVKDDSGTVKLTLWNDEIDKVKKGDIVKIEKGWCNEYQGEKSISAGKFGTLEITGQAEVTEMKDEVPEEVAKAAEEDII